MATITPQQVLAFWLGDDPDDVTTARTQARLWWSKDIEVDAIIRTRYADLVISAASGELDHWGECPQGELARIILLDQFPRNIYRDTAQAFAFDTQALHWALEGLGKQSDQLLRPVERLFFYLPLEHSENLDHQEKAVELFRQLAETAPAQQRATFDGFLDFAIRHRDIIARFGRFPHRNAILGRISTPDEESFLTQPGSSF